MHLLLLKDFVLARYSQLSTALPLCTPLAVPSVVGVVSKCHKPGLCRDTLTGFFFFSMTSWRNMRKRTREERSETAAIGWMLIEAQGMALGGKFLWSRTSGRQHIYKREILLIELEKLLSIISPRTWGDYSPAWGCLADAQGRKKTEETEEGRRTYLAPRKVKVWVTGVEEVRKPWGKQ